MTTLNSSILYEDIAANFSDDIINSLKEYSEMTMSESLFLNGLLDKAQPKKILEVGVAAGGSSLVILNAIKERTDCQFYSFDLSEDYYKDLCRGVPKDKIRPSGFLIDNVLPHLSNRVTSVRHLGGIAGSLESIGAGIDFCLLDTVHSIPGELIDFLCLLPYLSDDCILVLHDINLQYCIPFPSRRDSYECIACRVLFNSVASEKKVLPKFTERTITNIGAFKVSSLTRENVVDIFNSLLVNWYYMPSTDFLDVTRELLKKHYSDDMINIFDTAVKYNSDLAAYKAAKAKKVVVSSPPKAIEAPTVVKPEKPKPVFVPEINKPWLSKWWVKAARVVAPKIVDSLLIAFAGAFDSQYYFNTYPELLKKGRNPIFGYVRKGAAEGRNPNSWFNTREYLLKNPEVAKSGINPFVHYLYSKSPR